MTAEMLVLVALGVTGAGGVAWILAGAPMGRTDPFQHRIDVLAEEAASAHRTESAGSPRKGKSVKAVLREIEQAQRKRSKRTVRVRLRQAGIGWPRWAWLMMMAALIVVSVLIFRLFGFSWYVGGLLGLATGVSLPELALVMLRRRRLKAMETEFPNAIDVVVRSVKSGLPLPDALGIIANEAAEPLRSEFLKVVKDQSMGLPMAQAVEKFAQRVPLSEANFFAIVVAIQSKTGGSLSESLSNLANVLRERKKMQNKIRAMSSEAKASGAIIGSLPVVVSIIIYLTSPDYMRLLFDTFAGNVVIAGSIVWMLIGVAVMRKMINFDF